MVLLGPQVSPGCWHKGCWHRDAGTGDAGTRDAPGHGSKVKMKRLELAGSGGKETARGSGTEGAPHTKAGFSPQMQ